MNKLPDDEERKRAFSLFSGGNYAESLELCNKLLGSSPDSSLEILTATNLFFLGKLDDAEVAFRDLSRKMPESSHIHSYLAKVLEKRGDEGAVAEYAAAARLDPGNQDALRCYAGGLIKRGDELGALPVLRKLHDIGKRPDDLRNLVGALTRTGFASEACTVWESSVSGKTGGTEYPFALYESGRFHDAEHEAKGLFSETHDPAHLRLYLAARARTDPDNAPAAYASALRDVPDPGIFLDYIRLSRDRGDHLRALATTKKLLEYENTPLNRLIACEISGDLGDHSNALADYEKLIRDELDGAEPSETLSRILRSYWQYLSGHFPGEDALKKFLALIQRENGVVGLSETARVFSLLGNTDEARSRYYRAYRADYLNGGLLYAEFLASIGDERECEKVLLHILANARKISDLGRIAVTVTETSGRCPSMKRLDRRLIRLLESRRHSLRAVDREHLAAAYLREATASLGLDDFRGCMENCLRGIDVLPPHPRAVRIEDFLLLVNRAKTSMPTDNPVMEFPIDDTPAGSGITIQSALEPLGLTDTEKAVVFFIAEHKHASETDLRRLLGTRRIAGMVNAIIRKTRTQGVMILEKKGMGRDGEIYEYCGP